MYWPEDINYKVKEVQVKPLGRGNITLNAPVLPTGKIRRRFLLSLFQQSQAKLLVRTMIADSRQFIEPTTSCWFCYCRGY